MMDGVAACLPRTTKVAAVLSTGDNHYSHGLAAPWDEQVEASWRRVYLSLPHLGKAPWHAGVVSFGGEGVSRECRRRLQPNKHTKNKKNTKKTK